MKLLYWFLSRLIMKIKTKYLRDHVKGLRSEENDLAILLGTTLCDYCQRYCYNFLLTGLQVGSVWWAFLTPERHGLIWKQETFLAWCPCIINILYSFFETSITFYCTWQAFATLKTGMLLVKIKENRIGKFQNSEKYLPTNLLEQKTLFILKLQSCPS